MNLICSKMGTFCASGSSFDKKKCIEYFKQKKNIIDKKRGYNLKQTSKALVSISNSDFEFVKSIHSDIVSCVKGNIEPDHYDKYMYEAEYSYTRKKPSDEDEDVDMDDGSDDFFTN